MIFVMSRNSQLMLTQSNIIDRGWTLRLIAKFLPEPPFYAHNSFCERRPTKLWPSEMVVEVENRNDFKAELAKTEKYRVARNTVVSRMKYDLYSDFDRYIEKIEIPVLDDRDLRSRVYAEKNAYEHAKGNFDFVAEYASEKTVQRWVVNYIRHNFVNYDYTLYMNLEKGLIGASDAYSYFKSKVLEKIAEAYPQYAEECERQAVLAYVA